MKLNYAVLCARIKIIFLHQNLEHYKPILDKLYHDKTNKMKSDQKTNPKSPQGQTRASKYSHSTDVVKKLPSKNSIVLVIDINMSRCTRKPAICICKNKGADQLRSNCEADQHFCFRYMDSTIPLLKSVTSNFYPSSVAAHAGLCQT